MLATPARAQILRGPSITAYNPRFACNFGAYGPGYGWVYFRLYRYGQQFEVLFKPTYTLISCQSYRAMAQFGGTFTMRKLTGDRKEGSYGRANLTLYRSGKAEAIRLILVNDGALPGLYSRDRKRSLTYTARR